MNFPPSSREVYVCALERMHQQNTWFYGECKIIIFMTCSEQFHWRRHTTFLTMHYNESNLNIHSKRLLCWNNVAICLKIIVAIKIAMCLHDLVSIPKIELLYVPLRSAFPPYFSVSRLIHSRFINIEKHHENSISNNYTILIKHMTMNFEIKCFKALLIRATKMADLNFLVNVCYTHRLKCSATASSEVFSGKFPTRRYLVSRTISCYAT